MCCLPDRARHRLACPRYAAPAWAIWSILVFAVAMRLPHLFPATGEGSDIFQYVWDARVQRQGYDPLVVIPSDPAFAAIHTPDTRQMQHTHIPSPYPPAARCSSVSSRRRANHHAPSRRLPRRPSVRLPGALEPAARNRTS